MKVDVAKLADEVARRKRQTQAVVEDRTRVRLDVEENRFKTHQAPALEARVLAGLIFDPVILALCDSLEVDDFSDLRHRVVIAAVRNLRAADPNAVISAESIDRYLLAEDGRRHTRLAEKAGMTFLAILLAENLWNTYGEYGEPNAAWLAHDLGQLRTLADRRRAL